MRRDKGDAHSVQSSLIGMESIVPAAVTIYGLLQGVPKQGKNCTPKKQSEFEWCNNALDVKMPICHLHFSYWLHSDDQLPPF